MFRPMTPQLEQALVGIARGPAEKELGGTVQLKVSTVKTEGPWALVVADLKGADGKPFNYAQTSYAEGAREGFVSHRYAVLLKDKGGNWEVAQSIIGPTDPAWIAWTEFGAPESLLQVG